MSRPTDALRQLALRAGPAHATALRETASMVDLVYGRLADIERTVARIAASDALVKATHARYSNGHLKP